ncbi:Eukaryotic translation initiation factor eIF-1 [Hypocenomyce scalaris]|nr:Eukaryotic translation initiation factor eIF-1 [Hypocenomyce scalaris]
MTARHTISPRSPANLCPTSPSEGGKTKTLPRQELDTQQAYHPSLSRTLVKRNGRKTLTTVQGLPKKFDQKKILKVIKKKFACNGTIVNDTEMGEVIQLQGDQRKDVQEFLVDKKGGLELDAKTIKPQIRSSSLLPATPRPPRPPPPASSFSAREASTYPQNGQKHFRHPESLFRVPRLPRETQVLVEQQLAEKGEGASQAPPGRRSGAQGAAGEKRHMPVGVHTEEHGDARVESRDDDPVLVEGGAGRRDGGVVWRWRIGRRQVEGYVTACAAALHTWRSREFAQN